MTEDFKDLLGDNGKEDPTDRVRMAPQETLTVRDQEASLQGFLTTCQVRGSRMDHLIRAQVPTFKVLVRTFMAKVLTFKALAPIFKAPAPTFKALVHGIMAHSGPTDLLVTLGNKANLIPVGLLQMDQGISDLGSIIRSLGFKTDLHHLTEDPILTSCLPTLKC